MVEKKKNKQNDLTFFFSFFEGKTYLCTKTKAGHGNEHEPSTCFFGALGSDIDSKETRWKKFVRNFNSLIGKGFTDVTFQFFFKNNIFQLIF